MKPSGFQLLSDVAVHLKYAQYKPRKQRRETWEEVVDRNLAMHVRHLQDKPKGEMIVKRLVETVYPLIYKRELLPSMRSLQFAGPAIEKNNSRLYNCCYLPIDDPLAFSETMFLLLGGSGVGYSVQQHHVAKLPVKGVKQRKVRAYVVEDSIEGWADAIKALMNSFFEGYHIKFSYDLIRPKGSPLKTAGGKAPGPDPLRKAITKVSAILDTVEEGVALTTLQVHDVLCHIADAVRAGGIRRSALIALFSKEDTQMLTCKSGNWWETNEQRGRANNSVVLLRGSVTHEEFNTLWDTIHASKAGEPGFYWTNDVEMGTNPCVEIGLRPFQFCNL